MNFKLRFLFSTVILFNIFCYAQSQTVSKTELNANAIETGRHLIEQLREIAELPGIAVAVGMNSEILWEQGFGFRDLENNVAATPDTRFRIGSVSKIITATAAARLFERGLLDIDAQIEKYLPSIPEAYRKITTRQLAGHLAGVRHYKMTDYEFDNRHFDSLQESLKLFTVDPLLHEPGSKYFYSTFGFVLLSAVVESASGTDFLKTLDSEVFDPLKMIHSGPDLIREIIPNRTRYYERDKGRILNAPHEDPSYKWAAGGLISTAGDLVRLGMAHVAPGYFKQQTLDLLFNSQRTSDGKETGIGFAWRIGSDWKGRRVYHHAGNISGGRAVVVVYPETGLVISLVTNLTSQPAFVENTAQLIAESFLNKNDDTFTSLQNLSGTYEFNGIDQEKPFKAQLVLKRLKQSYEGTITGDLPLISVAVKNGMPDKLKVVSVWMKDENPVLILVSPFGIVEMPLKQTPNGYKYSVNKGPAKFEGELRRISS